MKKIRILSCLCTLFLLTACAKVPAPLSLTELEEKYDQMLTDKQQELSSHFDALSEHHQTTTEIQITFPASTSLQGNASYLSSKYIAGKNEADQISFNASIQNFWKNIPLITSGTVETHYIDQKMYLKVRDFNLFMGEGNVEVHFINLLVQQLSNRRILLDQQENIGVSVVETPTIPELITLIADLYDHSALSYQEQDNSQTLQQQVIGVQSQHLSAVQQFLSLLTSFISLPITTDNLALHPEKEHSVTYSIKKQNIIWEKVLYYQSDETQFSITTTLSPTQMKMTIKDIRVQDDERDATLTLSLTQKKKNVYLVEIKQTKDKKTELEASLEITISRTDAVTSAKFKGEMAINAFQLAQGENIRATIKGTKTLQNAEEREINISGDVVKLSALLE